MLWTVAFEVIVSVDTFVDSEATEEARGSWPWWGRGRSSRGRRQGRGGEDGEEEETGGRAEEVLPPYSGGWSETVLFCWFVCDLSQIVDSNENAVDDRALDCVSLKLDGCLMRPETHVRRSSGFASGPHEWFCPVKRSGHSVSPAD